MSMSLPAHSRRRIDARALILAYKDQLRDAHGLSDSAACEIVADQSRDGLLPAHVLAAAKANNRRGTLSRAGLLRWEAQRRKAGLAGLASQYKGRAAKSRAWDERAIELYRQPQNPGCEWVARQLRDEGYDASGAQVRRLIARLPVPERARGRMSAHERRNKVLGFQRRDLSAVAPNDVWMADGHTVDVRVLHPLTGRLFRPELTAWMDVGSRLITAAFLGEKENRLAVAWAFSHGVRAHGIPAVVYTDNGPGYVAADLADEVIGLFARCGSTHQRARPYNAKAKAPLERWFGTLENDFGRRWPTYCGRGMSPDAERRMIAPRAAEREKTVALYPTFQDYWTQLQDWIRRYNTQRVHSALGCTPYEAWKLGVGEIKTVPADMLLLPRVARTVARGEVQHEKRIYHAPELIALHGRQVWVEYDPWDAGYVRVLDHSTTAWICDARQALQAPVTDPATLGRARLRQRARLLDASALSDDEARARALDALTTDDVLDDLELLRAASGGEWPKNTGAGAATPAPGEGVQGSDNDPLDLYRTDY